MAKTNSALLEPILEIKELKVTFKVDEGNLKAVDGLNLRVNAGEVLGIVGESGSGKSVSVLSVTGLIKTQNRTTTGSAKFLGRELLTMGQEEMSKIRGKDIGFIFQNPMSSLNPTLRIGPQISEGMLHHGLVKPDEAKAKVIDLLEKVGIKDPSKRYQAYPHELSGGLRQRVMIAIALGCNPQLLIADEPTTALDVSVEKQILELMMDMQRERGLAILMITHNLPVALNTCSRILVMYAGRIMEIGTAYQLVSHPAHPYTRALFSSNLELGRRGSRIESIQGNIPPLTQLPSGCRFHPRCPLATNRCREESPIPTELSGEEGHLVACHYPQGGI